MANTRDKKTVFLVIGTWALVIVGLLNAWVMKRSYDDQLKETRKTTELTWRPFLQIGFFDPGMNVYFRLGETATTDTVIRQLDEIRLDSPPGDPVV